MSYCYAHRIKVAETELIRQLRRELYVEPYHQIQWSKARDAVAKVDCYAPHHKLLDVANCMMLAGGGAYGWRNGWVDDSPHRVHIVCMDVFERVHSKRLRKWSLREVVAHIRADDRNTKSISIGPVRWARSSGTNSLPSPSPPPLTPIADLQSHQHDC